MRTPIVDFLRDYQASAPVRFHMPGHKGSGFLGCEGWDITEVRGADALYEADGIIAESERNAAALFGAGRTCFSTEGSSQCIRAMLYLAVTNRAPGSAPVVLAARNVHKAFVYAAALVGFETRWLWPEESRSLCACPLSPEALKRALAEMQQPPAAVYLTSPDYLGGRADIGALAAICRQAGTPLLVDNAHGAYLHFLKTPAHPLDLGAAMCCDSAHKTLPVLTGGAYLHAGREAARAWGAQMKAALCLFGSTSPSYLTLASLDECNRCLQEGYRQRLAARIDDLAALRTQLTGQGWRTEESDPLRLTLRAPQGETGVSLADRLRQACMECEYADREYLVLMITPENKPDDLTRLARALGENDRPYPAETPLPVPRAQQEMTIREAFFRPRETVPVREALGRVCASPTVACPPAIPIAMAGERIGPEAVSLFERCGVGVVEVVR